MNAENITENIIVHLCFIAAFVAAIFVARWAHKILLKKDDSYYIRFCIKYTNACIIFYYVMIVVIVVFFFIPM